MFCVPGKITYGAIHFQPLSIEGDKCFASRRMIKGLAEALFTFPQRGFRLLALRDVPDRCYDHEPFLGVQRAEAYFNRKLALFLPDSRQLQTFPHRTQGRCTEVASAVRAMATAHALGEQNLD